MVIERTSPARASSLERPRDQLLASLSLAEDQHRRVRRRHALDLAP